MTADSAHHPIHRIFADAKGVIFDLNGVLVEDEPLHERAFANALEPYGVSLTQELYQATILGQTDAQGVALLAAAVGVALPVATIVQSKERLYRELLRAEGSRFVAAGAVLLAEALSGYGLRLALASASPAVEVYTWLDILALDHAPLSFDPILTSESAPGSKPSSAVYEAVRKAWGVSSNACVVIDDHPENIRIARALGMRTVGVTSTLLPPAFTHAQLVTRNLADLCG